MPEINKDLEFSMYFKKISPKEIDINKEDIFYRDKYNEIINYIKVILTDSALSITVSPSDAIPAIVRAITMR